MKFQLQSSLKGLTKDPFWLVTVLLAVIFILFFCLDILPFWSSISTQQTELQKVGEKMDKIIKRGSKVPTEQWVKQVNDDKNRLADEKSRVLDFYRGVDKNLKAWFPALNCSPEKSPDPGAFISRYEVEFDKLVDLLKDKGIKVGTDSGDQGNILDKVLDKGNPNKDNHRVLQKRFWLQKKLIEAMIDSNVLRCKKIGFIAPTGVEWRGGPEEKPRADGKLLGGLATPIPVELQALLCMKDVPTLVYNLIKYSETSPLMTIKKIEVKRVLESIEKNSTEVIDQSAMETERGTWNPPAIELPIVQLTLTGEVLDFDIH
jgi:hypothetical protein